MAQLHGSCACERNQYTIIIPRDLSANAQVFFDNSLSSRRSQATPVTAWLRIPLDWYHSATYALFPDESHSNIKRTFSFAEATVRRQFCGYCGTHLTAWDEAHRDNEECLDVTLGSLMGESIEALRQLDIISDDGDEEEVEVGEEESGNRGGLAAETYIPIDVSEARTDAKNPSEVGETGAAARTLPRRSTHRMQNRGIPYFEDMVEESRLGRIKYRGGGHTSQDGRTTVQWEVVEVDHSGNLSHAEAQSGSGTDGGRAKRLKVDG